MKQNEKNELIKMLDGMRKGDLIDIIMRQCQKDKALWGQIMVQAGGSGETELAALKDAYEKICRPSFEKYGYVTSKKRREANKALTAVTNRAVENWKENRADLAVELAVYALEKVSERYEHENYPVTLSRIADTAIHLLEAGVEALSADPKTRAELSHRLIEFAQTEKAQEVYPNGSILLCALGLADEGNREDFCAAADALEKTNSHCQDLGLEVRRRIIRMLDGDAAEEKFVRAHQDSHAFREILIEMALDAGQNAEAERLCREGMELETQRDKWTDGTRWSLKLQEICQGPPLNALRAFEVRAWREL